jgi:hypothetical protein
MSYIKKAFTYIGIGIVIYLCTLTWTALIYIMHKDAEAGKPIPIELPGVRNVKEVCIGEHVYYFVKITAVYQGYMGLALKLGRDRYPIACVEKK